MDFLDLVIVAIIGVNVMLGWVRMLRSSDLDRPPFAGGDMAAAKAGGHVLFEGRPGQKIAG